LQLSLSGKVAVEGSDFEVRASGGSTISIVDLASRLVAAESRATAAESTMAVLSAQLSAAVVESSSTTRQVDTLNTSLQNSIGRQGARITAAENSMVLPPPATTAMKWPPKNVAFLHHHGQLVH